MRTLITLLALTAAAHAQDADQTAKATQERCRLLLADVDGIISVNYAGVKDKYTLILVVRDQKARTEAADVLGSDTEFKGLKVYWVVSAPKNNTAKKKKKPTKKPKKSGKTLSKDDIWGVEVTDCEIIAQHLKVKPTGTRVKDRYGRRELPCRLMNRQVIGPGGGHSYTYTKHRSSCPIRMGRVSAPKWSDNFMAWVFAKGYTPVARRGFLWPTELKGSDNLWATQASEDLKTRLPYIREGAEWTATDSGWLKTPTGWRRTGGYPGLAWGWSQPWGEPSTTGPDPTPTDK